jgi:hypothetical protein
VSVRQIKIIDRERGVQPSLSSDGRWLLCCNGESFNVGRGKHPRHRPSISERASRRLASPEMDICYKAARSRARRGAGDLDKRGTDT